MANKKIYIGSDHAGFNFKEKIKRWLEKKNISYIDVGNHEFDPNDDYPDYAVLVAKKVVATKSLGILICGSAQGVCIAANKIKGVRAAIPFSLKEARISREHNDANVICLSGWYFHFHTATRMIEKFLATSFSKEPRHVRRVDKIRKLELR
ncbi:MAG: RpiB/LacA/LacB family sugar-phosphate isomerase [Nanoarchaeota archaeon]|nr:RpiB/LacA/LacB family sugar-phosphate isomerase [Nanoarchaeota archaeon]MBU1631619.1 RpiB/LacA/LacB family sugar-phosphate isomerase [Nanoarchaeota archaeon]MBU1876628.1 RpiB/LacA/LacB family sugar-phosphate isomerase [Nanoarchaeota archaeon]